MRSDAEKAGDDRAELIWRFNRVVSDLAGGNLTFPPPFDLATSLALAANIDVGELAHQLFAVTAARSTQFTVRIDACSAEQPELTRQVIDTVVDSTQLLAVLLEGLLEELDTHTSEEPLSGKADSHQAPG